MPSIDTLALTDPPAAAARALRRHAAAARRDQRLHAALGDARDDLAPVARRYDSPPIRTTSITPSSASWSTSRAPRRSSARRAAPARARAAVPAREVARKVISHTARIGTGRLTSDLAHLIRERQVAPSRADAKGAMGSFFTLAGRIT
jgi:hypothetical protein